MIVKKPIKIGLTGLISLAYLMGLSPHAFSDTDSSDVDYYKLSPVELQNVPPGELQMEVSKLTAQNESDAKDLANIKAYNQAMCVRYATLLNSCPAMYFISTDFFVDDFSCDGLAAQERETKIQVKIMGDSQTRFYVLEADGQYRSSEFQSGMLANVTFRNIHNKAAKPPRFGEIGSLILRSVVQGTGKNTVPTGQKVPDPKEISIEIYVNNKLLLEKPEDFALYAPGGDSTDSTYLRVNPTAILQMRKQDKCLVSTKELIDIYRTSQKAAGQ